MKSRPDSKSGMRMCEVQSIDDHLSLFCGKQRRAAGKGDGDIMTTELPRQKEAAPQQKCRITKEKSGKNRTSLQRLKRRPGWTSPLSTEAYLPGFSTTDWIKLRRWQRMKDHARWITDFILEAHERTLFVTVTFFRFVSDRQAKEAGRRFFQKRLAAVIEGYVRV